MEFSYENTNEETRVFNHYYTENICLFFRHKNSPQTVNRSDVEFTHVILAAISWLTQHKNLKIRLNGDLLVGKDRWE